MSAVLAATRAEHTKIITLRSVWIFTGILLALQAFVLYHQAELTARAVADIGSDGLIEIFIGQREPANEAVLDFLVGSSLQMSIFLPGLAVLIAGQEFRGRQLGVSLVAVPRRGRLLVAKTLAASGYLLLAASLIAAISTAFLYVAIRDWNPGLLLSAGALTGHAKFVGYAVLLSLVSFATTIIARSALTGIVVTVALVAVTMTQVLAAIAPGLDALFPVSAGRNLLLNGAMSGLTAGPEHAVVVLVGWALATTVIAGMTLDRRDAR